MTGSARISGVLAAALLLVACKEDPIPLTARVNYTTCVGLEGNCSGDSCCANQVQHTLADEAVVDCEVRRGDTETSVRLNLSVSSPRLEGEPMIWGEDLQFEEAASDIPRPLRSCGEFGISEGGNDYPSDVCDRLDVRTTASGGGGCEIQAHIRNGNEIHGGFRCKELQLPAETLYLSTIYNGAVGSGEFLITGCDFRL